MPKIRSVSNWITIFTRSIRRPLTCVFRCSRGPKFRKHKAAVKMHTLLDLRGNIPTFIGITDGKVHDVNMLDQILPEAGAYVMDRGYVDFERLYVFTLSAAFFVVRTKSNVVLQRRYSHPVDKTLGDHLKTGHQ